MSAQLTKAQLVAALEQSHVAYQRLEQECARLREHATAHRYIRPDVRSAHDNYVAALVAAKHQAMSTRSVVRVSPASQD